MGNFQADSPVKLNSTFLGPIPWSPQSLDYSRFHDGLGDHIAYKEGASLRGVHRWIASLIRGGDFPTEIPLHDRLEVGGRSSFNRFCAFFHSISEGQVASPALEMPLLAEQSAAFVSATTPAERAAARSIKMTWQYFLPVAIVGLGYLWWSASGHEQGNQQVQPSRALVYLDSHPVLEGLLTFFVPGMGILEEAHESGLVA